MSAFTKVLVVFVLLLSVVFAAAQMVLFGLREDYGQRYDQAAKQLVATQADLADARSALADTKAALGRVQSGLDQVTAAYNDATKTKDEAIALLEKSLADQKVANLELAKGASTLTQRVTELSTIESQLKAVIAERNVEIKGQTDKIAELDKTVAARDETIRGLNSDIVALKEEKQVLAEEKAKIEALIEYAVRELHVSLPPSPMAPVTGQVVRVSEDSMDVVINKGKRDGVAYGYRFTLYNDAAGVLGFFVVTDLEDDLAAGKLELAQGKTVTQGDFATTELGR